MISQTFYSEAGFYLGRKQIPAACPLGFVTKESLEDTDYGYHCNFDDCGIFPKNATTRIGLFAKHGIHYTTKEMNKLILEKCYCFACYTLVLRELDINKEVAEQYLIRQEDFLAYKTKTES